MDYAELFSVLMYYYGMSKDEIMARSRRFIYALYEQYVKRACENLGVSPSKKDSEENTEDTYPQDFGKPPGRWSLGNMSDDELDEMLLGCEEFNRPGLIIEE